MKLWRAMLAGLAIVGVVSCSQPTRAEELDRAEFREAFIARLRLAVPDASVSVATEATIIDGQAQVIEHISITRPDDVERQIFLDQGFKRYQDGESVDAVFDSLVALATRPASPPYEPAQAYLLVRPVGFLDLFKDQADENRRPVSLPLAGDLVIMLGQDMGDAYTYPLKEAVLERHDGVQAAWTAAMDRTVSSFGDIQLQSGGDLHLLRARADIAASLLVDDAVWQSEGVAVLGDAPAVAVFRDALFIVDSHKPAAIRKLRDLLASERDSPALLSDQVFVRRNNRWAVLD